MTLVVTKRKALVGAVFVFALAAGGVVFGNMISGSIQAPLRPNSGVDDAHLAKQAFASCDGLAADPDDFHRSSAPVTTDRFAPGAAIAACEDAVRLNPDNATAAFELGRSYWVAARYDDAFRRFVATASYPAAMKYIGDAYLEGRLPATEKRDPEVAAHWYQKAVSAGVLAAAQPLKMAELRMRQESFNLDRDADQFQAPDYIAALYNGHFEKVQSPVGLVYYVQGLTHKLDDDNVQYMDKACKPLANPIGNTILTYAGVMAVAKIIVDSSNATSDERVKILLRAGADYYKGDAWSDTGERDGVVLFDENHYGCDSPVTKRIMNNIMVKLRVGDDSSIRRMDTKAE